ncbi:MAG: MarR family transcriptional regulator [Terracidiphilus sp.]
MGNLKDEIKQERDFQSAEEQALLNLIRTADCLDRAMERMIRPFGVTSTQYNALRILRGAHPRGLTCSAIGDRMITAEPDITRLLSRLKALNLIRQQRDRRDRRMLWTQISPQGLKLLSEMDPMIERGPGELLGHMTRAELDSLSQLAEAARKGCDGRATQPTCDGQCEENGRS